MSEKKRSRWTETHFYDNNISKELMREIQPLLEMSETVSKEEKLVIYESMRDKLIELNISNIGLDHYDKMIKSYIVNDGSNCDPINKLDAIKLLYIISILSGQNDAMLLLKEQLEDLVKGFCPQGRTVRFIQIISSFM